jgi:hypothetical protein
MNDDQIFDQVDVLFRTQINPAVAQHGGQVDLIDVDEGIVVVRMMGGCQGCGPTSRLPPSEYGPAGRRDETRRPPGLALSHA